MSSDMENVLDPRGNDDSDTVRPVLLADFTGQEILKEHIEITLSAAKKRGTAVDHMLFAGPPGLGKTTLAHIIANEMGSNIHVTSGPVIDRPGDLASLLTKLGEGDVLFIDEIHRLSRHAEEVLYSAMEDFVLDVVIGEGGAGARSIRVDLSKFTLVAATTRTGLLTNPLRDRFGLVGRLNYYTTDELSGIVERSARILDVEMREEGSRVIASRSRGTPRIANRLLRRVHDYVDVRGDGVITSELANEALNLFGVDSLGLDEVDRSILIALCEKFGGGPVGLSTLAIGASESAETVEEVHEPFLIQQGLLSRTPRGRCATELTWEHLGLNPPG